MRTFTKRAALVTGLLFTALLCCAVVFIDNTQTFWRMSGALVQLVVSNTVSTITVNTNFPQGFGYNTNDTLRSFHVQGRQPGTNATGNGTTAATIGAVRLAAGTGGGTFSQADAQGGIGGPVQLIGGDGGGNPLATNNATGNTGGPLTLTAGNGGAGATVATNLSQGGNGGTITMNAGQGVAASGTAPTNSVGGNGGGVTANSGQGGTPTVGWAQKGGNGGTISYTAGAGGGSSRTNGGTGGSVNFTAGAAGAASTGGNAGQAGVVALLGGPGANGNGAGTNSNGGSVFVSGGLPGTSATAGDVVVARDSGGTSRGGLMVGPFISGGSVAITNVLGGSASLDFPSTAAGTVSDLPMTVTGVTSNNVAVCLSAPWEVLTGNGGLFTTYNSNDTIFVRFVNNNLVTAIDPTPGTFSVVGFRIR